MDIEHLGVKLIHIIWGVLIYHEPFDSTGGIRLQMVARNAA